MLRSVSRTAPARLGGAARRASLGCFEAPKTALLSARQRRFYSEPRLIENDFAQLRKQYSAPKWPVVLCHGLCGFNELDMHLPVLPTYEYWGGIKESLQGAGATVITTAVPPVSSIQERAETLAASLTEILKEKPWKKDTEKEDQSDEEEPMVNLIAHSMGGLDSRYLIKHLAKDLPFRVASLTTIATPHHGTSFADWCFDELGDKNVDRLYTILEGLGVQNPDGFKQLTRSYLRQFNKDTVDDPDVSYYSYGAQYFPHWYNVFYPSWKIIDSYEGPSDGLVSVQSAQWGTYLGTINNCDHLDLINWTNRLRYHWYRLTGQKPSFNALAFYLHISDGLAKRGF